MSLFLETSGFGTGVYRYLRRGLVDTRTVKRLVAVTVPAAIGASVLARWVPSRGLQVGYGTPWSRSPGSFCGNPPRATVPT
jgi:uncharacterized membrane protein YfcA